MSKIALVFPQMDGAAEPSLASSEHLGLGYLAAVLRNNAHEVLIINAEIERLTTSEVTERILNFNPSVAGFSPVSLSIRNTFEIIHQVKKAAGDIKILLGGHLATMCGTGILQNDHRVDFVLKGDAEDSILVFLKTLSESSPDFEKVPGLIFHKNQTEVIENTYSPDSVDLNKVPFCERDDLTFLAKQKNFDFTARISAGRGCLFDCSFCTNRAVYGNTMRMRRESDVVDEMNDLNRRFAVKHFWFNDDLFIDTTPAKRQWVENFTGILIENRLRYTYRILCRADSFNNQNLYLLDRLAESGLTHIYFGIESGSQKSLDVFNKKITVEKNRMAVDYIRNKGIELTLGYIMFNPYADFEDLSASTNFLYELNELFRIFPLTNALSVYPNTPVAKRLLKDGLLLSDSYMEPLTCYTYKDERIGYLAGKMNEYYDKTYPTEIFINKLIKGLTRTNSSSEISLQSELNELNRDKFMFICSYLQNSRVIDDEWIDSVFQEWTAAKKRVLARYPLPSGE